MTERSQRDIYIFLQIRSTRKLDDLEDILDCKSHGKDRRNAGIWIYQIETKSLYGGPEKFINKILDQLEHKKSEILSLSHEPGSNLAIIDLSERRSFEVFSLSTATMVRLIEFGISVSIPLNENSS